MMSISDSQSQSTAWQDGLRGALEQAEGQITNLDKSNIHEFLVQMDKIEQMMKDRADHGPLHAEEKRWQGLLKLITTNPQIVNEAAMQAGGLNKLGSQYPPATGLWWHVDWLLADQRNHIWRRMTILLGTAVVVATALWLINNFIPRRTVPTVAALS